MARVLVVEHDKDVREALDIGLRSGGHVVDIATNAPDALRLADERPADIVVVDLSFLSDAAFGIVESIRVDARTAHAGIIAIADAGESGDAILTAPHAADHCLTTPFPVHDLLELIDAMEQRARRPGEGIISVGDLRIEREHRSAQLAGRDIALTSLEHDLLVTLYDRRGRIQTRAALLSCVWGVHDDGTSRTVDTHVKRLRQKLGPRRDYIETVRGIGYRFVVPSSEE